MELKPIPKHSLQASYIHHTSKTSWPGSLGQYRLPFHPQRNHSDLVYDMCGWSITSTLSLGVRIEQMMHSVVGWLRYDRLHQNFPWPLKEELSHLKMWRCKLHHTIPSPCMAGNFDKYQIVYIVRPLVWVPGSPRSIILYGVTACISHAFSVNTTGS